MGSDHVSIVPADAGLGFDAAATVEGTSGRIWNPVTLLQSFTGGPSLDPVVTVDDAKLAATVASVAADADSPAIEPTVVVERHERRRHRRARTAPSSTRRRRPTRSPRPTSSPPTR